MSGHWDAEQCRQALEDAKLRLQQLNVENAELRRIIGRLRDDREALRSYLDMANHSNECANADYNELALALAVAESAIARVRELCERAERFGSTLPYENLVPTTSVLHALDGNGEQV